MWPTPCPRKTASQVGSNSRTIKPSHNGACIITRKIQSAASATALAHQIQRLNDLVASFRTRDDVAELRGLAAAMASRDDRARDERLRA